MQPRHSGTTVVLQFSSRPALEFVDIVTAFEGKLRCGGSSRRQITWDGDDLVMLDCGPLRIALGWVEPGIRKNCWFLIIAIGPTPGADDSVADDAAWTALADRIVADTGAYLPFDDVLRCPVTREVDATLIDLVTELVLSTDVAEPAPAHTASAHTIPAQETPEHANLYEDHSKSRAPWSPNALKSRTAPKGKPTGDTPVSEEARMRQLREILTEVDYEQAIGLPTHLILYSFCLAMFLQVPKVGGALTLYGLMVENVLTLI